jgi:prepilin-type N-terminal cleavage/methylation domain-containing protein
MRKTTAAFTLVELLVVIAIISLLAAMLLPVLREARVQAKNVTCVSQQRQVTVSATLYTSDNGSFLPSIASAGNPSTCQTAPFGFGLSGFGLLYAGGHVGDHRILYCPDAVCFSGWAVGLAGWTKVRRDCIAGFPASVASRSDSRVDYVISWWGGAPTLRQFENGAGFGRQCGGRKAIYWMADGYDVFAYYYSTLSHDQGRYMNLARLDGGVKTLLHWRTIQPTTGDPGYYWPYNDRPDWGFWRYFGTGLGI